MKAETVFADTNLFLRYMTNDVPDQANAVEALLVRAGKGQITLITTNMVIAEIVWTLESYYHLSKVDIEGKVLAILNTPGLDVADADLLLQAIVWYVEKNVDFIDAYNVAWMLNNKIEKAYTFDQKHFSRLDGVTAKRPE